MAAFGNPSQSHIGLCQSHFLAKDMEAFHRSQPFPKGWGVPPTRHSFSKLCASPSSGMDLVRNRCTKMRYFGATLRESLVEDTPIETDDVSRLICPTKSSDVHVRICRTYWSAFTILGWSLIVYDNPTENKHQRNFLIMIWASIKDDRHFYIHKLSVTIMI